jgi:hypothetical protein
MSNTMGHRLAVLAFMAGVTAYLLARTLAELAGGMGGAVEAAVYGISAVLGLRFIAGTWAGLWGPPGRGEQPQS